MNKKFLIAAIILIVLGALFFFARTRKNEPTLTPKTLEPAPAFSLQDYNSQTISLENLRGKPALIYAWASWCASCRDGLSDLAALKKEFGDRVAMVAINRAEPLDTAKRSSDALGLADTITLLLDPSDSFYRSLNGFAMPEILFIDRQGFIRRHTHSSMETEEIRRSVQDMFNTNL